MALPEVRPHAKAVGTFAQQLLKDLTLVGGGDGAGAARVDERAYLSENGGYLSAELGCEVVVQAADDPGLVDPGNKARAALPGRVAIFVE